MRAILLQANLHAVVDDADYPALAAHKWFARKGAHNKTWYAARRGPGNTIVYMHREILAAPAGTRIEHINGNGLDNQRQNLATGTPGRFPPSNYRGVHQVTKGRWRAEITVKGELHGLGLFPSEESAAQAYSDACEKYGVAAIK